jgi:dTDP-D-glucose 4,6-dehydratase
MKGTVMAREVKDITDEDDKNNIIDEAQILLDGAEGDVDSAIDAAADFMDENDLSDAAVIEIMTAVSETGEWPK